MDLTLQADRRVMSSSAAGNSHSGMQQRWQQPRFDIIAYLRSHGRQVRQKVKEICLSKHNRLLPTLLDRAKQKVERQRRRGFRSDSSDVAHYREFSTARSDSQSAPSARRLPVHSTRRVLSSSRTSIADTLVGFHVSNVPVKPDISPERSDFDKRIDRPFDILLRLPGDGPDQTHQAVASIDTQLMKVNLMRREVWDERLNEHGRGHLELDHNAYTSDFHVIEMGGFDILIGSDTITQYGLVSAGFDLRYHMRRTDANERYQESQIEHHTTDP